MSDLYRQQQSPACCHTNSQMKQRQFSQIVQAQVPLLPGNLSAPSSASQARLCGWCPGSCSGVPQNQCCALSSGFLLLHQLLNSPLVLKLLKADGVTAVASAVLDFGPLAQGLDHFSASELHFTAADNKLSLPSDACLDVKV